MAKTNIGRVSVVPKGEYSSTENYKRLDVVSSDGSMYISKKDNNIGNPLTDENWWFKAVEKGEVGAQGEKPVNGVDYNTPEEKEEFKNEVVSTATTEVKQNIETIKEEAIQEFNSNASTKTNEYNDNTTTKLSEYNTNANSKVEEYNSNATQKTNTFNENATTQTETFNNNATSKTNDFNSNASTKTDEFNTNYEEKLESINEASTSIEQERVISDGKYARALKTPVTDIESTQIYAENDVVDDLVINGVELTQKTREGYNEIQNEVETSSMSGIDITRNSDGSVTLNGTATKNITLYYSTKSITLNGKYIFYLIGKNNNINLQGIEDGSTTVYLAYASSSNYIERSYEADTVLSSFFSYIAIGKTFNNETYYPMITKGEEVKPYEEYGASPSIDFPSEVKVASEQNITINETNITIPLTNSAIGQYTDTIDRENNVQNKFIQELTLTGDENWTLQTSPNRFDVYNVPVNALKNAQLCTHFKTYNEYANAKGTFALGGNYIRVYNDNNMTLEEWKAFLAQQNQAGTPVKFYYVAENPTTNPLSEEVQTALSNFKLYQDLNNIFINNGTLSFKYNKSLLRAFEEQSELSASLLERIQALEQAQVNSVGGN